MAERRAFGRDFRHDASYSRAFAGKLRSFGMLFNSINFILLFLPVTLLAFYLVAGSYSTRLAVLAVASLVFYGFWDVRFVPLLAGSAIVNWLFVQAFARRRRSFLPVAGVVLNLIVLGVFKYTNFFLGSYYEAFGDNFEGFSIILPIGISFFTFQQISYLVDLKRGTTRIYGFLEYFVFVTFFPQLIAGPIVRHNEIIDQYRLDPRRLEMWENLSRGSFMFLIGLFKKVVLADGAGRTADEVFAAAAAGQPLGFAEAWTGDLAYGLQIYFDFSGYSDMAIGLAMMFGLALPINFDAPYRACSIREFWRRWHITLSRFLRDYVYIPLGGNRLGVVRQAVNVVITMLLAGLWHGAAWTFVVWGGLHGVALAVNAIWRRYCRPLPPFLGWVFTLLFVMTAWVAFRAPDFATAGHVIWAMAGGNGLSMATPKGSWLLLLGGAIVLFGRQSHRLAFANFAPRWWMAMAAGGAAVFLLMMIQGLPPNEFIYFQF